MCMLYAFSADKKYRLNKSLRKFYSNSTFHPHGWGLAAYDDNNKARIAKDKGTARKSSKLRVILFKQIATKLAIAHIRYATMGNETYNNAHPFTCTLNDEDWVFAHNGSVSNIPSNLYIKTQGETDSEKVFCYMQQELIAHRAVELNEKIKVIEHCIEKFSKNSKLNLAISDGTYLYIHCNFKNSLYSYQADDFVCFCTKPLSNGPAWQQIELNKLMVYKDGKKVYEGKKHANEYFKKKSKQVSYLGGI